ncbi:hypothetical protein FRC12_010834 [Ceratobasidium sp. 428]|nr:hypothetical protein FRC12_010834 [Ceratobasidium sp. 428]
MPAPTAHINANNAQPPRQRTAHNATKLIARYVAKIATAPGLQDSAQTVRSIVADLKPTILQAPRANDKLIRQELARMEEIKEDVTRMGEEVSPLDDITDADSAIAHFRWQLQGLSE